MEVWLQFDPFGGGWQVITNRFGYPEILASGPTMDQALRDAALSLQQPIVIPLGLRR